MNSLGVLLLASVAVSLAAGQGTNPGMQRRYRPELQRFRRQPQQTNEGGLLSLPQRLLKKVGLRGQAPRPSLERRLGPASQNRRLRPAAPQQRPQVRPQQEKAPVLPEAESRRFQEFRPEPEVFEDNFENYYEEPEPVYQREPEPVYQPRPQRQSSGANRAPIRTADKRLDVDSDLSESVPIPSQQRDIEAAVHAGAAGFQPEGYAQPQKVAFQIHGQEGPHSYRFGYDTGTGYNRQFRYEARDANGVLHGRYGYYDQEGKLQIVNYTADPVKGFHAEGDHVPKPQY